MQRGAREPSFKKRKIDDLLKSNLGEQSRDLWPLLVDLWSLAEKEAHQGKWKYVMNQLERVTRYQDHACCPDCNEIHDWVVIERFLPIDPKCEKWWKWYVHPTPDMPLQGTEIFYYNELGQIKTIAYKM
jgi:hypothetical protein